MPVDDREDGGKRFRRPPTGPWVTAPRAPEAAQAPQPRPPHRVFRRSSILSTMVFLLIVLGVGIRAYRDLSRPEAWAYWKDQYFSPSLTSSLIPKADLDGSGRSRPTLAIRGRIGPA